LWKVNSLKANTMEVNSQDKSVTYEIVTEDTENKIHPNYS
jgi:hypothetical protein